MEILKQKISEALNEYNQKIIENVKIEPEKTGIVFSEFSKCNATIDKAFIEASERRNYPTKTGFKARLGL